jgi:hypothetical protein
MTYMIEIHFRGQHPNPFQGQTKTQARESKKNKIEGLSETELLRLPGCAKRRQCGSQTKIRYTTRLQRLAGVPSDTRCMGFIAKIQAG